MSNLGDKIRNLALSFNSIADEIDELENRTKWIEDEHYQDKDMMKQLADIITKRYGE